MGYFQNEVSLDKEDHRYFNRDRSKEYVSVSKVFELVKTPFDSKSISMASAKKVIREDTSGKKLDAVVVAQELQQKWKENNKRSTDHGTRVHDALELFGKTARIDDKELEGCVRSVYYMLRQYPITLQEEIVYSDTYGVAGMIDKPCLRTTGAKGVVDIWDYKTNIAGLSYFSKYGKWFKTPLEHLEDCNFNEYAVKLSVYGVLLEEMGRRVGSLALVYIDPFNLDNPKKIPIPYMKMEALSLLEAFDNNF